MPRSLYREVRDVLVGDAVVFDFLPGNTLLVNEYQPTRCEDNQISYEYECKLNALAIK